MMPFLHPDEARECQRCGHRWRAEKWTKLDAQQPIVGIGITARAQDLHRQTVHERRDRLHRAWRYCPECGSKKAKTLKGKDATSSSFGDSTTRAAPTASSRIGVEVSHAHLQDQQCFSVRLIDAGKKKIQVIKALRSLTGLGLRQAKELVESAPVVVFEAREGDRARHAQQQLDSEGAVTELLSPVEESETGDGHRSSDSVPEGPLRPSASPALSVADELEKLVGLRDRGVLTMAEFEAAKNRLLR